MIMRPTRGLFLALVVATPVLLAGCSTSDSASLDSGERMQARGEQISERGTAWTDGQSDVREGNRLVEKSHDRRSDGEQKLARAQKMAAEAEKQIAAAGADRIKGENLVTAGTAQMERAEASYSAIRSGPSAIDVQPSQ
jgi:hypothetical protein